MEVFCSDSALKYAVLDPDGPIWLVHNNWTKNYFSMRQ